MTKAREIRLNSKASFGLNYELIEDVFFPTPYFDPYVSSLMYDCMLNTSQPFSASDMTWPIVFPLWSVAQPF